jgi:hypothetical protein
MLNLTAITSGCCQCTTARAAACSWDQMRFDHALAEIAVMPPSDSSIDGFLLTELKTVVLGVPAVSFWGFAGAPPELRT